MPVIETVNGLYLESPTSLPNITCAQRPSPDHILNESWHIDPMNPEICWRLKTPQELDSEKQEHATNLLDYKIAIKALAQVTWNSVPALKTAFPTYQDYQSAIISRYKALI